MEIDVKDIRKGDKVRMSSKLLDNSGEVSVVDFVEQQGFDYEEIEFLNFGTQYTDGMKFELLDRPKPDLPTEPGLYTVTPPYFSDSLEVYRLFRLTDDGWKEMYSKDELVNHEQDGMSVEDFAGKLRKLGVEDGN